MPTFLMKCPSCGKHFEVERTGEQVEIKDEVIMEDKKQALEASMIDTVYVPSVMETVVESTPSEQMPVAIEKKILTENYKCKHCGYTWNEGKEKTKRENSGTAKTGSSN
jgi:transposase-like protein